MTHEDVGHSKSVAFVGRSGSMVGRGFPESIVDHVTTPKLGTISHAASLPIPSPAIRDDQSIRGAW